MWCPCQGNRAFCGIDAAHDARRYFRHGYTVIGPSMPAGLAAARRYHATGRAGSVMNKRVYPQQLPYDPDHDAADGQPWSEADLWDLRNSLKHGQSVEQAA